MLQPQVIRAQAPRQPKVPPRSRTHTAAQQLPPLAHQPLSVHRHHLFKASHHRRSGRHWGRETRGGTRRHVRTRKGTATKVRRRGWDMRTHSKRGGTQGKRHGVYVTHPMRVSRAQRQRRHRHILKVSVSARKVRVRGATRHHAARGSGRQLLLLGRGCLRRAVLRLGARRAPARLPQQGRRLWPPPSPSPPPPPPPSPSPPPLRDPSPPPLRRR